MGDGDDRWQRGMAMYREVYGDDAVAFPQGSMPFFDVMIEQLFAEVWTRPALDIPTRRLLSMGVLAAQHRFDVLGIQFERALRTGELTAQQVRETVLHLVAYVGYPASGQLLAVSEAAIAAAGTAP